MGNTSTLIYLVDDLNLPSDMVFTPFQENTLDDPQITGILDMIILDPGEKFVSTMLQRPEFK